MYILYIIGIVLKYPLIFLKKFESWLRNKVTNQFLTKLIL